MHSFTQPCPQLPTDSAEEPILFALTVASMRLSSGGKTNTIGPSHPRYPRLMIMNFTIRAKMQVTSTPIIAQ